MKIERKLKRSYNSEDLKPKKHRPVKRYVSEARQTCYTDITDKLNNPEIFTYNDINRNQGLIELYKKQFNEVIRNYGVDLQYFRKYNTFFEEDEGKHTANMTYGEDTVAEFYASGMVRAFLDIESYDWQFNNMGFENLDQITIYIGIDNFRQKFFIKFCQKYVLNKPQRDITNLPNRVGIYSIAKVEKKMDIMCLYLFSTRQIPRTYPPCVKSSIINSKQLHERT